MYLAVIVLPLLGSMVSGFFGRKVGVTGAQLLTSLSIIATAILSVFVFFEVAFNNVSVEVSLCRWVDIEVVNIPWGFNFDFLTVSMLIPVLIISSLVHVYSVGYMSHDPHNQRFFSYLSLFSFMMIILVTSNNFLLMFVGWEGVGICSYLLVNFWFTRIAANQSSVSALLTNRVGDCFLTIGMFIMLLIFGNLDYATVFTIAPFISEDCVTIIGICLLIGAMAKSSQIGLHVWLPLAMEGPTPVSALIHAATMVTAGVYLLMRASPIIEYSSTVLLVCLWIGSVTTVFSSVIGLFQQDIKKVIAYSTMSQLGMMMIAIGLSCYNVALFHLVNHAFYKGLLFLGAGAVIHAVSDNQDFRKYGGLILFLPLTYAVMLIASLSLAAFPFMTGFYSKDFILECSFAQFNYSSITVYFTAVIGAIFTTLYSVKVLYLTFIANPNAPSITYTKVHEADTFMSSALVILALFSIFFGFITKDIFIGLGSHAFTDNSIFIHPVHELYISSEFGVSSFFKLLPFALTLIFIAISIILLEFLPNIVLRFKYTRIGYNTFAYLNLKFLVESLYNRFITYFILQLGGQTTKVLDKGSVEKIGPYGLETFLMFLSRNLNMLNTGIVTTYALYILVGFMLYVSLPFLSDDTAVLLTIMFCAVALFLSLNYKNITDFTTINLYSVYSNKHTITKSLLDPLGINYIFKYIKQKVVNVLNNFSNPPKPNKYCEYKGTLYCTGKGYIARSDPFNTEHLTFNCIYSCGSFLAVAITVAFGHRMYKACKSNQLRDNLQNNAQEEAGGSDIATDSMNATNLFNWIPDYIRNSKSGSYINSILERTVGSENISYISSRCEQIAESKYILYINSMYEEIATSKYAWYVYSTYQQIVDNEYACYVSSALNYTSDWTVNSRLSPYHWYKELGDSLIDHPTFTLVLFGCIVLGCYGSIRTVNNMDNLSITNTNTLVRGFNNNAPDIVEHGVNARFIGFVHTHLDYLGNLHHHARRALAPDFGRWPSYLQTMFKPEVLPKLTNSRPLSEIPLQEMRNNYSVLADEHVRYWTSWLYTHNTTYVRYHPDYMAVTFHQETSWCIWNPFFFIPNFSTATGISRYAGNFFEIVTHNPNIGLEIIQALGNNFNTWMAMVSII